MTPREIKKRLAEAEAKEKVATSAPPDFIDDKFPVQKALLLDESALLAVLCTRRAAKSFSAVKRLLRAMYKHPGCSTLFLGLTLATAKRVVWKDTLRVLNKEMKLGGVWNKSEPSFTLPNGSVLYILGVDADDTQKEKLLGQKYAEVAIDESASYSIDLNELVYGVLKPAVADYRGTIGLYGTPANLKKGLFFELTKDQNPATPTRWRSVAHPTEAGKFVVEEWTGKGRGWSGHCWNTFANPYMAEKWKAEIDELIRDNPRVEETPTFKQMYLGLWVIDESKLVYRYLPVRNDFSGVLPLYSRGEWHFVLAIDLGFNDATSFTVCAYHDHDKCLYVLSSFKRAKIDITAKAEIANGLKAKWPVEQTIIDGANADAVAELNNRHDMRARAADKTGKADFIDIMNDEFIQERIKLGPDTQELKDEYAGLIWDERQLVKLKRVEHPGCANHATDGTLYGWRFCWPYLSTVLPTKHPANSPAAIAAEAKRQADEIESSLQQQMDANRNAIHEENEAREWD